MNTCKLCHREYESDELIAKYCPECRENYDEIYEIQVYELRLAIEKLKEAIKSAWKDIFT